jgi:hypothetical protein
MISKKNTKKLTKWKIDIELILNHRERTNIKKLKKPRRNISLKDRATRKKRNNWSSIKTTLWKSPKRKFNN